MNVYDLEEKTPYMDSTRLRYGKSFARKALIPHWFEIASGIFVGLSMVLIFAAKMPPG